MHAERTNFPIHRSPLRARFANLFSEGFANLRLGFAVGLGSAGLIALLLAMLTGLEQQLVTSGVAGITPLDAQHRGFFMVDPAVEPIGAMANVPQLGSDRLLWFALLTLVAGILLAAWQIVMRRQRARIDRAQRIRRARSGHLPPRVVAKRQALLAALVSEAKDARRARLTVRQLMSETFAVASPAATMGTLVNLLASGSVRQVLICEYGGRLLGVVTARDLQYRRGKRAADVMTRAPICVPPGALLGPAATLMVDHQISCLPVVEQGLVRGVLTLDDLALALDCLLQSRDASAQREVPAADETTVLSEIQTLCETAHADDTSGRDPARSAEEIRR